MVRHLIGVLRLFVHWLRHVRIAPLIALGSHDGFGRENDGKMGLQ